MKGAKRKGSRLELKSRDLLRQAGYLVVKAGGSLGPVDLVALHPFLGSVQLIQCKANMWPSPQERAHLAVLAGQIATNHLWQVVLHRYDDRKPLRVRRMSVAGMLDETR